MQTLLRSTLVCAAASGLCAQGIISEIEPNDSTGTATPVSCDTLVLGSLVADESDYFELVLAGPAELVLDTSSRGAATKFGTSSPSLPSLDDSRITLYDASGLVVLSTNDDNGTRLFAERGFFSRVVYVAAAGTYYIEVHGFDEFSFGDYALHVRCLPEPTPFGYFSSCTSITAGPSEIEPNNLFSDVGVVNAVCCRTSSGSVDVANDEDVYLLYIPADTVLRLDAFTDTSGTGTLGFGASDTQLELREVDGLTLIEFDDDDGVGLQASIQRPVVAGFYYVMVDAFGTGTGDYILQVDCGVDIPAPVRTLATRSYDDAGCAGSVGVLETSMPMNGYAIIGSVLRVESFNSAGGASVAFFGFPAAMPVDLTSLGAPGCVFSTDPIASPVNGTVNGPTTQEATVFIPMIPALVGVALAQQWVEIDAPANALGVVTSDRLNFTIGDF